MKTILLSLCLLLSANLRAQMNGGFENWDTTSAHVYQYEMDSVFFVPNAKNGIPTGWTPWAGFGVAQTTGSFEGSYAVVLHNWYNYAKDAITRRDSISYRPAYLQGNFKYNTGGIDPVSHGWANITMLMLNGDTVGTGYYEFNSMAEYSPFQVPISYSTADVPDSIVIEFWNAEGNCGPNIICNLLYLDAIQLSNAPLAIATPDISTFSVFPNPAEDVVTIENSVPGKFELEIFDFYGRKVKTLSAENRVDVSLVDFPAGVYVFRVLNGDGSFGMKKVVKMTP